MKRLIFISLCLILFTTNAGFADSVQYPPNSRYIIVNPNGTLKASSTFLLDTKTGKTWQLVIDNYGTNSWQQMEYDWYKQDGSYGGKTRKTPLQLAP